MINYKHIFANEVLKLNEKSCLPPSATLESGQNAWHDIVHFFFLFKKRDENIHSYMFSPLDIEYYKKRFKYDVLQDWYNIVKEWKTNLNLN